MGGKEGIAGGRRGVNKDPEIANGFLGRKQNEPRLVEDKVGREPALYSRKTLSPCPPVELSRLPVAEAHFDWSVPEPSQSLHTITPEGKAV